MPYIAGDMDFHALHAASGLSIERLGDAFEDIASSVPIGGAVRFRRETVREMAIADYGAGETDLETALRRSDMDEAELRSALAVRGLPQAETRRERALSAVSSDPMIPRIVAALRHRFPDCQRIWLAGERAWGIPATARDDDYELFVVVSDAADGQTVYTHTGCLPDREMHSMLGNIVPLDVYVFNTSYFAMLADDGGYCRRIVQEGVLLWRR
jgi:hypothetical protein